MERLAIAVVVVAALVVAVFVIIERTSGPRVERVQRITINQE